MDRAVNLILFFPSPKSQRIYSFVYSQTRRMFALKGSFGFDLIIPMDSLTFIPFSCCEKIYEEFDNNVCKPNKLDFIFRSAKS